jgi:quercetin dioxygenase-like cupin family protein
MVKIAKPFVTNADDSPAYWQIGNLWQVMATGVQTDNAFTLLDQVVHDGGGGGPITHTHAQDEGLYVISGKCTFNAGGHQGLTGPPGTFVSIPPNTEHSFTVDEPDTHVLNFYLPAGFEQLLIGISHPAKERQPPPPELIQEMMAPRWLADKLSEDYGQVSTLGNPFADPPDPAKMFTKPTPGATVFPFTANAQNIDTFSTMGGRWTILAAGKQTEGCYCLLEVRLRKGVFIAPRIYKDKDEMFYVFDGNMTLMLGDRLVTAAKGSLVYIPSGTVYSARVDSDQAHCLNLHTRSGFEEFIEYVGTPGGREPDAPGADFQEKSVDVGARSRLLGKIGLQELAVPSVF